MLEISSDTILLGSQKNLKGLLSWQTRAIKLHSLQKFILEPWRGRGAGCERQAEGKSQVAQVCKPGAGVGVGGFIQSPLRASEV